MAASIFIVRFLYLCAIKTIKDSFEIYRKSKWILFIIWEIKMN